MAVDGSGPFSRNGPSQGDMARPVGWSDPTRDIWKSPDPTRQDPWHFEHLIARPDSTRESFWKAQIMHDPWITRKKKTKIPKISILPTSSAPGKTNHTLRPFSRPNQNGYWGRVGSGQSGPTQGNRIMLFQVLYVGWSDPTRDISKPPDPPR